MRKTVFLDEAKNSHFHEVFLKKLKLSNLFWDLSENFTAWKQKVFGRYWKVHSTCPEVRSWRKCTCLKKLYFYNFFSDREQKFFRRGRKHPIYLSRGNFWGISNLWKMWNSVNLFGHWANVFWSDPNENFGGVVRTAFFSRVCFLGNKYFLKNYRFSTIFGILDETFVVVIKTCILTVLGINVEEKSWLGKVLILIVFGHWAKTFRPDSNMFLARKRNFHSTCARDDVFWGTHFQKRCNLHFYFFQSLSKKSSSAPGNFFDRVVKIAFYDSIGRVWVNTFSDKIIDSLFFWVFQWKILQF